MLAWAAPACDLTYLSLSLANGKDPEESVQNPQAESGGLQQTPGYTHGALRHSQSQLDEVAPSPGHGVAWGAAERQVGVMFGAFGIF